MTGVVEIRPGALVSLADGEAYIIVKLRTADMVLIEHRESFKRKSVALADLRPVASADDDSHDVPPEQVNDERWEAARDKATAVERVFELGGGEAVVKKVAEEFEVHPSTLYRWIDNFSRSGRVIDLYRKSRNDAGKTRLSMRAEALMRSVIRTFHRTQERPSPAQSHRELDRRCKLKGLPTPSMDTFRGRLLMCEQRELSRGRGQIRRSNKQRLLRLAAN